MKSINLRFVSTAFIAVLSVFTLSCESEDNDENGGVSGKRFKQINSEEWNSKDEKISSSTIQFTYDANSRIVKMEDVSLYYDKEDSRSCVTTYQYEDNRIICNSVEERIYYGHTYTYVDTEVFTLEDGLITSITDNNGKKKFILYDNDGYLKTIKFANNYHDSINYIWSDGNLMKIEDITSYNTYAYKFSYSVIPLIKGFITSTWGGPDAALWNAGYFGKRPNYLFAKCEVFRNNKKEDTLDEIEYFLTDGLVTKVIEKRSDKDYHNGDTITSISTIAWE